MLAIGVLFTFVVTSSDSNSSRRHLQTVYDPECPWKVKCYVVMDSHLIGGSSNGTALEFAYNETTRVHSAELCVKNYDINITIIGQMQDPEMFNEHKNISKEEASAINSTRRLQEKEEEEEPAVPGMCSHGGFVVVCSDETGNLTNPLGTLVSSVSGWMVQGSKTALTLDNLQESNWTMPKASARYTRGWNRNLLGSYLMVNDTYVLEGRAQQLCDHSNSRYVAFRYVRDSKMLPQWTQIAIPAGLILIVGVIAYRDWKDVQEEGGKPVRVMYYSDTDSSSDDGRILSPSQKKKLKEAKRQKEKKKMKAKKAEKLNKRDKNTKKDISKESKNRSASKGSKKPTKDSKSKKLAAKSKSPLAISKINLSSNKNGGRIPQEFFFSTLRSEDFESLSAKRRKRNNSARVAPKSAFPVGAPTATSRNSPTSRLRPLPQKSFTESSPKKSFAEQSPKNASSFPRLRQKPEKKKKERMDQISEEDSWGGNYSPAPPPTDPKVTGLARWSQLFGD